MAAERKVKGQIKAWAVLTLKDRLKSYGNGAQFQFPLFDTLKEARAWRDEAKWDRGGIVPVVIAILPRKPRKGHSQGFRG